MSDVIVKRIDGILSSLHFTTMLPVLASAAIGLVAILFSITGLDLISKVIIMATFFLLVGVAVGLFLRSIHLRQDSLWELYAVVSLKDGREKVNKLPCEEVIRLQKVIAEIQRSRSLQEKSYDKLLKKAKGIIEHTTGAQVGA